MAEDESIERSRSTSENTLKEDRPNDQEAKKEKEQADDSQGQEEKGEEGPPKPVGFLDPSLHKIWKEVAWKWLLTSKLSPREY